MLSVDDGRWFFPSVDFAEVVLMQPTGSDANCKAMLCYVCTTSRYTSAVLERLCRHYLSKVPYEGRTTNSRPKKTFLPLVPFKNIRRVTYFIVPFFPENEHVVNNSCFIFPQVFHSWRGFPAHQWRSRWGRGQLPVRRKKCRRLQGLEKSLALRPRSEANF